MPGNNVKLSHFTNTWIHTSAFFLIHFLILCYCWFFGRWYLYSFCKDRYSRKYLQQSSQHFNTSLKGGDVNHPELTCYRTKSWSLSVKDSAIPMKSSTLQSELYRKIMILLKQKNFYFFIFFLSLYEKLI